MFFPIKRNLINSMVSNRFFSNKLEILPEDTNNGKTLLKNKVIISKYANFTENLTYENVRKSAVGVFIYYSDLKYTLIKENKKMILVDLISSIGGTLGLFIGISFLSFLEIFEILFEVVLLLNQKIKIDNEKISSN